MSKTYAEKLKDPRWQQKRLRIMERAGFACQWCGDKTSTLHVHHGYYERGFEPWDYHDRTLLCLCEACHERAGTFIANLHRGLAVVMGMGQDAIAHMMQVMCEARQEIESWDTDAAQRPERAAAGHETKA